MANIETLKKITYEDMPQFLQDLNANLAIIQNSPLFKGVLGDDGEDGDDGLRGERGSRFLFVNIDKFYDIFGSEISKGSDVNIAFLNNKLANFVTKKQLTEAFGVTEFVDKDIVVLTNSVMLYYDVNDNVFVDSGQAFNPENNFVNNIEDTIERIVKREIENNQSIKNLSNVFDYYVTLGKNYADDNSVLITDKILNTTVYSPYIPNYNNKVGIEILNHNYYGYTDERFPITHNGTMIFGSIKRYYQMLMKTVTVDGDNTLTSDYAVGVNNIPSLVFLQDTYNNGIMFGYKGKNNLKSFGSIYKNDQNEMILKSDSSQKQNEFSSLKLHKDYLRYDKVVNFTDNLNVHKNVDIWGNINNGLIRTGTFTKDKRVNDIELGNTLGDAFIESNNVNLSAYEGKVLVTDMNGKVLKTYEIETKSVPVISDLNMYDLTTVPKSSTNVLTSNYFHILATRFNSLSKFVSDNYYMKSQYETGEIPSLVLGENLVVKGNTNLADLLVVNKASSLITIKPNTLDIESSNIKILRFKDVVLVTNTAGEIVSTYKIATANFEPKIDNVTGKITDNNTFTINTEIITSKYYNIIMDLINKQNDFIVENYWRKSDFTNGSILDLVIGNSIIINNPNLNVGGKLIVTETTTFIKNDVILDGTVTISNIKNKVLVTDSTGIIINTYTIDNSSSTTKITDRTNPESNEHYTDIEINLTSSTAENTSFVKYNLIKNIVSNINDLVAWVGINFWRKDQYKSGEIPSIKTSTSLETDGTFRAGLVSNPHIITNGNSTQIGQLNGNVKVRGNINFEKYPSGFVSTNTSGDVNVTYKMGLKYPKIRLTNNTNGVSNGGAFTVPNIENDYWGEYSQWNENGTETVAGIRDIEQTENNVLNGKHFRWIFSHLSIIHSKFKQVYTKVEVDQKIRDMMPIGSVIDYYGTYASIPDGWSICDGRTVQRLPLSPYKTPDLINKFRMGINGETYFDNVNNMSIPPRICGSGYDGKVLINDTNLPTTNFNLNISVGGSHQHDYKDSYWIEAYSNSYNRTGAEWGIDTVIKGKGSNSVGDNKTAIYYRNMSTYNGGSHTHPNSTVRLNNSSNQNPIKVNPNAYNLYPIIKYK